MSINQFTEISVTTKMCQKDSFNPFCRRTLSVRPLSVRARSVSALSVRPLSVRALSVRARSVRPLSVSALSVRPLV